MKRSGPPPRTDGSRSATLLATLAGAPRLALVAAVVLILLGGAFAPTPVGPLLLALVAALIGWLTWLTWSISTPGGRLMRLVALGALLAFAVGRF